MSAGFMFLIGVFLLWIAFTSRGRAFTEALTGMKWTQPPDSSPS